MKKLTRVLMGLFAAAAILLPVIQSANVSAQATALTITPRKELVVQKGETKTDNLPVGNPKQDEELILTLKVVDFTAKNQTGAPSLNLSDDSRQETWSLKKYITIPKEVTLKAGQTTNVPFSVTMPANIGAGSYYSAIQYVAQSKSGENVSVAASATTLVFVSVPGDAKQQMSLQQLGAFSGEPNSDKGEFKLFYFGSQPKVISYVLKNSGNVAERPVGSIILKNSFTGKVTKIDSANPTNALALIGQERRFDTCIKTTEKQTQSATGSVTEKSCDNPGLSPGRYTVTLSAFYGQENGKSLEVSGTSSFWYLPTWFVIACIVIILAVVTLIWWIINKVKNRTPVRRR
ncbi:MAG: DUF916 domain-containing protein [Candidatus Saccharimonadales bacterium]